MLQAREKIRSRNLLVKRHEKLVWRVVHRMSAKCNEPQEDLFQEGCIGLIKAINGFDKSLGNAFSSFAVPYIEGAIRHYLRDRVPVVKIPRNYQETHSKVRRIRKHCANLGRDLSEDAIAQKIGVTEQSWRSIKEANRVSSFSWDELIYEPNTGGEALGGEDYSSVYAALTELNPNQRYVIRSHYFLGKSESEIAATIGVSTTTVRAIIQESIFILNQYLSKNYD